MIQPDIDPTREPLMAQSILCVAEAAGGVLRDVHGVLGRGAVEESLSGLLRCPGALCGSAGRCPLRVRDAILAASRGGSRRHIAARRASAARRAACIRACATIRSRLRLAP